MSAEKNIAAIQQVYEAFGRGDIPYIIDQLTDDVEWMTHLESSVPWAGEYLERTNVMRFFQAIAESGEVLGFEPMEIYGDGDTVVSIGYFGYKAKSTGKSARTKWVFIWKFRGDKICSYEQFHDPKLTEIF